MYPKNCLEFGHKQTMIYPIKRLAEISVDSVHPTTALQGVQQDCLIWDHVWDGEPTANKAVLTDINKLFTFQALLIIYNAIK